MVRKILFLTVFLLTTPLLAQTTEKKSEMEWGYQLEDYSFTTNAHGVHQTFRHEEIKKWNVEAGFRYVDRFDDAAPGYLLGGSWWLTPETVLSAGGAWAPKQTVLPHQDYHGEITQVLWKKWIAGFTYRFADYSAANSHTLAPALTWHFYPHWSLLARYYFALTQFTGNNRDDHSVMTKVDWNPFGSFFIASGYARSSESFESGNPVNPFGRFTAHHWFGSVKSEIYKGLGLELGAEHEKRSNGTRVNTYSMNIFYRWQ